MQIQNAAGVVTVVENLQQQLPVSQVDIRNGLLSAKINGRMQRLDTKLEQIVDVAHNPHAARELAHNLKSHSSIGRTHAVVAMLADKDMSAVCRELCGVIDHWYVATLDVPRGASCLDMAAAVSTACPDSLIEVTESVLLAWEQATSEASADDRIVIFGSFYTVAEVLQHRIMEASDKQGIQGGG